ncbi:hypothetical protein [Bacillus sp. IBL03825]|uniref:hypothetical protein n=1 Tax=Bacillus sp. IBL03825 TaxID=2953580 RepID=UPI0021584446|nr:hypothetical protein [Bacillus sp. IBL03825]MCR6850376.1 hypothetical protein [Bacillus sp. IBL03825]
MEMHLSPNISPLVDEDGIVRNLQHHQEPYMANALQEIISPEELVEQYLESVKNIYKIEQNMLSDMQTKLNNDELKQEGSKLKFLEKKTIGDTTVISYTQTYLGIPVRGAGITITIQNQPLRVINSKSTLHYEMAVQEPSKNAKYLPGQRDITTLLQGVLQKINGELVQINSSWLQIYKYDPLKRFSSEVEEEEHSNGHNDTEHMDVPMLSLEEVPEQFLNGNHYVVNEVVFTANLPLWKQVHFRVLIDVETGVILRQRNSLAFVQGKVFTTDPVTRSGSLEIAPCSSNVILEELTDNVQLQGIVSPDTPSAPIELKGEFVEVKDFQLPSISVPTSVDGNFSYPVNSNDFTAVNAYYHCDALFRYVKDMGFDIEQYFDGTEFPVPVDHFDFESFKRQINSPIRPTVNAAAPGNALMNGSGGFRFALASLDCSMGIACDQRVVWHEFGHTLLWDHVHSPNMKFVHSFGDTMGAILNDPISKVPDRFLTFPFNQAIVRRHDRNVESWAWGGNNDDRQYGSEQILSTTLFRIYRSIGGDANGQKEKEFASRYIMYLLLKGIVMLTRISNPRTPEEFARTLISADVGTNEFEGNKGGAVSKIIRWGFEKQGAYQPLGTERPITTVGEPPKVDVYINDGRNGEYQYQQNFWCSPDIWNRTEADNGVKHETPIVGEKNYIYVRVKNRGTNPAEQVMVKTYHSRPAVGLVWPDDWKETNTENQMTTDSIPSGGESIIGPFEWVPQFTGHEFILAKVSAPGDIDNTEIVQGSIPSSRLVPFDNNIAMRSMIPLPGAGGSANLTMGFGQRKVLIKNPFNKLAKIEIEVKMPSFLHQRNWNVITQNPENLSFILEAGAVKEIVFSLKEGEEFTMADIDEENRIPTIGLFVQANEQGIGGVTYLIDKNLTSPAPE